MFWVLMFIGLAGGDSNWFEVQGAHTGRYEVSSSISFNDMGKVWILRLVTPRAYRKEHGSGFSANLFFSKEFTPTTGRFPVKFHYRGVKDTLGGSFIISGEGREMYSFHTEGHVVFTAFGDRVEGHFEFKTQESTKEDSAVVLVKGAFSCARGDALK